MLQDYIGVEYYLRLCTQVAQAIHLKKEMKKLGSDITRATESSCETVSIKIKELAGDIDRTLLPAITVRYALRPVYLNAMSTSAWVKPPRQRIRKC